MQARDRLDALIAHGRPPGVQYLHISAGDVLFACNAGLADLTRQVPVSDRTTFNAYSVTKTFTAAATLKLAEQGKLSLDQPIAHYLARFPYSSSPTIRETLAHRGGFPNPIPLSWVHLVDEHAGFDKARFVEQVLRANARLKAEPGQAYGYSNIGYLLLGEIIETVSGQPYAQHIEQHLIQPLRLRDGETLAFTIPQMAEHASGYLRRWSLLNLVLGWFIPRGRFVGSSRGRWVRIRPHYVNGAAYGGLIGNAHGLARYLQALLARDDYLSAPSRALLFTPAYGAAHGTRGREPARSLGWFTGRLRGEPYAAHAGGGAGFYCEIRVYPRIARASVVMINRTGIRDERLLDRVDGVVLR